MEEGTANTNILTALKLFPNPSKSTEASSIAQPAPMSGETSLLGVVIFSTTCMSVIAIRVVEWMFLFGC